MLFTSDLEVRSKRSSATAGVNLSLPKTVRNSSYKATILDLSMMCVNLSPFLILNSFKYLPFSDTVILEAQCCKPNGGKGDTVPGLSAAQGPGAHRCQGNSWAKELHKSTGNRDKNKGRKKRDLTMWRQEQGRKEVASGAAQANYYIGRTV